MKGIFYNRHGDYDDSHRDKDDWHQPVAGETIVLNHENFSRFFPEVEIQGEIEWNCDRGPDNCRDCNSCGQLVELVFTGETREVDQEDGPNFQEPVFTARHVNREHPLNIGIGEFSWDWSGHGASEWWFDERAIALKSTGNYRSSTGLTADSSRIVAYQRHVEVDSFRGDCGGAAGKPEPGKIWAGFVNNPTEYRANWTGFAVSSSCVGDDLDRVIRMELGEEPAIEPTVCRHNRQVSVGILTSDPKRVSYFLCLSCRQKGIRWEEFTRRNRRDTCPYFRRACKSVTERSDAFPRWFRWEGDNLLSSHRRMSDGDYEAYEVTYVRRKEGFVRRAVLLANNRTREAWMYRYAGFIPRTLAEFRVKYTESRRILGFGGTSRNKDRANWDDPESGFLTESMVRKAVEAAPLWEENGYALFSFRDNPLEIEECPSAVQKARFGEFEIVSMYGEEVEPDGLVGGDPQVFYADSQGNQYYLVLIGRPWVGGTSIRHSGGQEVARFDSDTSCWYLFRTPPAPV